MTESVAKMAELEDSTQGPKLQLLTVQLLVRKTDDWQKRSTAKYIKKKPQQDG